MKFPNSFLSLKQFLVSREGRPIDQETGIYLKDYYNPDKWISGKQALDAGQGISFVVSKGWFTIDLDDCIDDEFSFNDVALEAIDTFKGCYIEVSNSRHGLHIIGRLDGEYEYGCKNSEKGVEVYTEKKIIRLTCRNCSGNPFKIADTAFSKFAEKYVPNKLNDSEGWTEEPCEDWFGPVDNELLIKKLKKNAKSARLWKGDISDYNDDHSSADFALCMYLAFWTGKNCQRIEELFSLSKLGERDKWLSRDDYRKETILRACANTIAVATVKKGTLPQSKSTDVYGTTDINNNGNICTIEMQKELFKDCVYLESGCRVFDRSRYTTLDKNEFCGIYNSYMFAMDWEADKFTEDAYKAFRDNRAYKPTSVRDVRYEPSEPYGKILEGLKWSGYEGIKYVNAFGMPEVFKTEGDISPFLNFMKKLIPDERDRNILYGYIAGIAQNRGKKIRWCPVLQGTQGNGKTTVMRVLEYIVGTQVGIIKIAEEMFEDKYNAWMEGKIFVGIDELKKKTASENSDKLNDLVTGHTIGIRRMYSDWIHYRNFINFMICTNYKDALEINEDTRRWCVFYTAQQSKNDLLRDGMTPEFFIELNDWLDYEDGFAKIADYFYEYEYEKEFDPFLQARAPITSSLKEASVESMPAAVKKILEAVEEGIKGFKGGWISKPAVSSLLGYKVYRWKEINDALSRCGYVSVPKRTTDLPVHLTLPSVQGVYQSQQKIKHTLFVLKDKQYSEDTFSEQFLNDQT